MNFISSRKNCFAVDSCSSGGAVTLSRTASSPSYFGLGSISNGIYRRLLYPLLRPRGATH